MQPDCSYVNGHAIQHFKHKQQHCISIDCKELSVYWYICFGKLYFIIIISISLFSYICDDFVINENCSKLFHKLRRILQENQK